ncbi:hypothetical protein [Streptomyces arenae]|uniref:hypothetical protein n=1 Tax=Streptomyces arenae TaxID=29301 RepID=UPI002659D478|nr:hypothetical protein [Streptomyces arenae]MCG7207364.1 hypothetical protein [Streptomyces arenae]
MYGGDGADAQGVALAASYGHALVERGPLGGLQFGRSEEVGDLARHVLTAAGRDRAMAVPAGGIGVLACGAGQIQVGMAWSA